MKNDSVQSQIHWRRERQRFLYHHTVNPKARVPGHTGTEDYGVTTHGLRLKFT